MFDVAIVGAGPAGLHAAACATEKGLNVALIEKRRDIDTITRYCSEHIILDENYNGDTIQVTPAALPDTSGSVPAGHPHRIASQRFGWSLPYTGALCPCRDKFYYSADLDHHAHFAWADGRPFAWKYSKGAVLQYLLDTALARGISYLNETTCYQACDDQNGVRLKCVCKGERFEIRARKLLAADGTSAQVAQSLGMNEGRMFFATAHVLAMYLSNVRNYNPHQWCGFWGSCYGSNVAPLMGTGPVGHFDWADVIVLGTPEINPFEVYDYFTTKSPVAWMFEHARVEARHCCTTKAFAPLKTPYRGNCLVIGDAAGFVEVQTQGALTCGFLAAQAVADELEGKPGFVDYTRTWLDTFEFNDDGMMQVTTGYALIPYYTDDEVVYLFSLLDGVTMKGSWSQYESPRMMWDAIHRHDTRIARERPALWKKICAQQYRTLDDTM